MILYKNWTSHHKHVISSCALGGVNMHLVSSCQKCRFGPKNENFAQKKLKMVVFLLKWALATFDTTPTIFGKKNEILMALFSLGFIIFANYGVHGLNII